MTFKYTPPRKRFFKKAEKNEKKKNVSFRFPVELMEYYDKLAKEIGVTTTDLIIDILDSTAEQMEKEKKKRT